ncbi:hypothetical protein [Enterobacter roggenkampii]|uniref:hypothetical protein n=1 Tax=Enterobacter roggenkampii TaxID=1812935 RepID=UPI001644E3EC
MNNQEKLRISTTPGEVLLHDYLKPLNLDISGLAERKGKPNIPDIPSPPHRSNAFQDIAWVNPESLKERDLNDATRITFAQKGLL